VSGRLSNIAADLKQAQTVGAIAIPEGIAASVRRLIDNHHAGAPLPGQEQELQGSLLRDLSRQTTAAVEGDSVSPVAVREMEAFAQACGTAAQQVGLQEHSLLRLQSSVGALGVERLPHTKDAISGRWLKVCFQRSCSPLLS
jgi:hypothetical protein